MEIVTNIFSFALIILFFGGSIFIHELGHFLAAKKRGLEILRFSVGFGPKLFSWERDGIEYRLSMIPFGGYVALPQLADMGQLEGGDKEAKPLPSLSFTDKFIVSIMGPVFNVIFAFVLSMALWGIGKDEVSQERTTQVGYMSTEIELMDGSIVPGPAYEAGLQVGDKILTIDGEPVTNWMEIQYIVLTGTGRTDDNKPLTIFSVARTTPAGTETIDIPIHPIINTEEQIRQIQIWPAAKILVGELQKDRPGEKAGILVGDRIHALDGNLVYTINYMHKYLNDHQKSAINVTIEREGALQDFPITPIIHTFEDGSTQALIGVGIEYEKKKVHYTPIQELSKMMTMMQQTITALFHKDSNVNIRNMSGPIGIMHSSYLSFQLGFYQFLWLITFININLAILNLMPFPVLDGGHILFAFLTKLRGKPLPVRFIELSNGIFVVFLISVMLYVTYRDIFRLI